MSKQAPSEMELKIRNNFDFIIEHIMGLMFKLFGDHPNVILIVLPEVVDDIYMTSYFSTLNKSDSAMVLMELLSIWGNDPEFDLDKLTDSSGKTINEIIKHSKTANLSIVPNAVDENQIKLNLGD